MIILPKNHCQSLNDSNRKILRELPIEVLREVKKALNLYPARENDFQWILSKCIERIESSKGYMNNFQLSDFLKRHGFENCAKRQVKLQSRPYQNLRAERISPEQAEKEIQKIKETKIPFLDEELSSLMQARLISQIKSRVTT